MARSPNSGALRSQPTAWQPPTIGDSLLFDEDVDVPAQSSEFVANVEGKARSDHLELANHISDRGRFHENIFFPEGREECVEMPRQLDLYHGPYLNPKCRAPGFHPAPRWLEETRRELA